MVAGRHFPHGKCHFIHFSGKWYCYNHIVKTCRIGLFGIGLEAYWPQFRGLKARLEVYLEQVARKLARPGVEIVNLGLIDSPSKSLDAGHRFRREDVDLIFIHVTTYALSSTVLPVVQRAKVPVMVLNLAPEPSMDYAKFNRLKDRTAMTGEWLENCSACAVPEIANVFKRARIPFHQITGMLHDDPVCWDEVDAWIEAARVANIMFHNRLGLMGHYYGGMLDVASDLTQHCATFGGHMEIIEVDELAALRREVTARQIARRVNGILSKVRSWGGLCPAPSWNVPPARRWPWIGWSRNTTLARWLTTTWELANGENEDAISSIILGNSLLTARGIPVAGEYEVKNVQAMKIMDAFGVGGSFTEYYAMDFKDDVVLMGHDGPGHIAIAQGKTKVRPLDVYHGKVGRGLSVEMSVKHGPVTLAFGGANRGGPARAAGCRGRVGARTHFGDWQYQQPLSVQHRCAAVCQ